MSKKQFVYLMFDGCNYKIGKSQDPNKRLLQLATANSNIKLIAYSDMVKEKYVHDLFASKRLYSPSGRKSEWFDLNETDVVTILRIFKTGEAGAEDPNKQYRGNITWDGGEDARLHGQYHHGRRVKSHQRWTIKFGKYRDRKLVSMQSEEEVKYIENFINSYRRKERWTFFKGRGHVYDRFVWWMNELRKRDYRAIKCYFRNGEEL
jgi:hypothetical protein|tara:strand:- start:737 stop:1354 length:618 start_codon:yes stop_codon:yes gene_type:complete